MHHDIRGLELTTDSRDAAEGFDQVLNEFLNYELVASRTLKGVLEADPGFVMGQVLRAYLLSMLETSGAGTRCSGRSRDDWQRARGTRAMGANRGRASP